MNTCRFYSLVLLVALLPASASAQTPQTFRDIADIVVTFLTSLFPLLVSVALLAFLWGLIKFIAQADNDIARKEGKEVMVWGVVALFVMVSIWGIVAFVQQALFDKVLTSPTGGTSTESPYEHVGGPNVSVPPWNVLPEY